MKIRNSHVSNSSSSSFIIEYKDDCDLLYDKVQQSVHEDTRIVNNVIALAHLTHALRIYSGYHKGAEDVIKSRHPEVFESMQAGNKVVILQVDYNDDDLYRFVESLPDGFRVLEAE